MIRQKAVLWIIMVLLGTAGLLGTIHQIALTDPSAGEIITVNIPNLPGGAKSLDMVLYSRGIIHHGKPRE